MKKTLAAALLLLVVSNRVKAQDSRAEMAIYNMAFGSVVSGVGALINKKPGEQWDKVLFKGMTRGALGGYFVYQSKNLIGRISKEEKWGYGWYAKLANAAGTSIIENASSNRDFWGQWHINLGFNRFELHTREKLRVKYKIMPISLLVTAALGVSNKFELNRSLQTGELIFSTTNTSGSNRGRAYGSALLIKEGFFDEYDLYSHEILHIYQYYDFNFVNAYLNKPYARWGEKSKSFSKFRNLFYLDMNGPAIWPLYFLKEGITGNNFFENEANFWEH